MSFVETKLCAARQHCIQCRALEGGRNWRTLVKRVYGADSIDFECPVGLPWLSAHRTPEELEPFKSIAPGLPGQPAKKKPERRNVRAEQRQMSDVLYKHRERLRTVLATGSPVVEALDALAAAEKIEGGCKGCRRKRFVRALAAAYEKCDITAQSDIQAVISKG